MAKVRILYISYDGLTDPLGQSQILPYLIGLSKYGNQFTILSFEKKDRYKKEHNLIKNLISETDIIWSPVSFTSKPLFFSKFYDAIKMRHRAITLHKQLRFDMVHCRSYIAADVGLYLKLRYGIKFFFDMRGFWADEKKDGSWDVERPFYNQIYKYYKGKEAQYLQNADHIISLTNAGKKEIISWKSYNDKTPISVIPCCADMEHFSLTSKQEKERTRQKLNISLDALVISYLGSIGTWYMLDEMLLFFKKVKEQYRDAIFLFVTQTDRHSIDRKIEELKMDPNSILIMEASRSEVPQLVKASDINISFIKPVYSKLSSSPTKLGEVLSMGIPVIVNEGVGDVKEIVENAQAGFVLKGFSDQDFEAAIQAIPSLLSKIPTTIREAATPVYDLKVGIELYKKSYEKVLL